ncbi:GNAT family N-acetyltransferase [Nocardioides lianchengensis]|uniref:Acetyltransferase (GNAT) domain-containing protein n=1 Tax=Nocardioides lianchengensis TaxID=1045774 RepID=A0A1G6R783_9ACTN|nr:GNAT family N-acetyltransferase [Nocardioides lianchengensis]NYG10344.1 GNAT superfamily N-acetyltransferase [Nocardioides lianchengensis]SDD00301.1 Acetyltransferase (GNAT) domain-containing protein [Nocardioides lianchengensis]
MEVLSRAWRTDLALLEGSGSVVEHHGTYVVVRTPDNPGFRWGNFLLLRTSPKPRQLDRWLEVFAEALPDVRHRTFGVDDPAGGRAALKVFADRGYRTSESTVLTADDVHPPRHPNHAVELRPLTTDDDWAQRVDLAIACNTDSAGPAFETFATRQAEAERRLATTGSGAWFGAFDRGRMLSGLGIFRAGPDLARFQNVETHPENRGRGLAGTLVHHAGRHALDTLGVSTLVIVADPDYHALRIYQGVGFGGSETQLQAELDAV